MKLDERLRTLIREDLERGLVPAERLADIERRARQRRRGRRLLSAVLAGSLAVAVLLPLILLRVLGSGSTATLPLVETYGIEVALPSGWEGHFYLSPGRGPVFIAANYGVQLPEAGHRLIPVSPYLPAGGGSNAATVALFEYPPDRLSPSGSHFPALQGPLKIAPGDIKPCAVMRDGCVIRYLSIAKRNFVLIASFAAIQGNAGDGIAVGPVRAVSQKVVAEANRVLRSLAVKSSGYELGISCSNHGLRLNLSTSTGGVVGWSPLCLAAPAGRPFSIHFRNRLTTVRGRAGLSANVELYPNEVLAYSVEDQSYGQDPSDRQHAVFVGADVTSPGSIVYRVPALAQGVYYLTSGSGLGLNGLSGVLIISR